ncbi:MAG: hypothetical protein AB3X41_08185 [Leptothrix ochracea]|uniref:hypothetical protein n=1 Tax=Leptothrix ochracea TaxID=735331 RepID=UPI0034E2E435
MRLFTGFVSTVVTMMVAVGSGGSAMAQTEPAQGVSMFKTADLKHGEHLIDELACDECHARRVGGDGHAIYRPKGRINSPAALRGMVQYCATQLNHPLFPEDVLDIAAVLQRDHYRFKD